MGLQHSSTGFHSLDIDLFLRPFPGIEKDLRNWAIRQNASTKLIGLLQANFE
jgi:hypothetical protein